MKEHSARDQKMLCGPKNEIYSSNIGTVKQEWEQVEKCARNTIALHFLVGADCLCHWSRQASNRFSLSTSPLPMCCRAAIFEIVSQEWLRTTFLWTRIKREAAFPGSGSPSVILETELTGADSGIPVDIQSPRIRYIRRGPESAAQLCFGSVSSYYEVFCLFDLTFM